MAGCLGPGHEPDAKRLDQSRGQASGEEPALGGPRGSSGRSPGQLLQFPGGGARDGVGGVWAEQATQVPGARSPGGRCKFRVDGARGYAGFADSGGRSPGGKRRAPSGRVEPGLSRRIPGGGGAVGRVCIQWADPGRVGLRNSG